jgi:ATP-dependent Clp protease ATP-binding subunit ClpA
MDLNLRSGRSWPGREPGIDDAGANGGGWSYSTRGAQEPIQVDDQVEACCNSAYDAAQFHGAAEVQVEHLLHAMTRIKAAAELMEQLGIRTASVRQETAVIIASVHHHTETAPRTSKDGGNPAPRRPLPRRKTSATVADLLRAVLSLGRKAPTRCC